MAKDDLERDTALVRQHLDLDLAGFDLTEPWVIGTGRAPDDEMAKRRVQLLIITTSVQPTNVRGAFYAVLARNLVGKEGGYRYVQSLLGDMREAGLMPWPWIVDLTRDDREPSHWQGVRDFLDAVLQAFSLNPSDGLPFQIAGFVEKVGMRGVFAPVCETYGVALWATRGYDSKSRLHDIALAMAEDGRPAHIFNLGDHDPSGEDIQRDNEDRIRRWAPDVEIVEHRRLAVLAEHIAQFSLPTRPKNLDDPRPRKFRGDAVVDLDAIPAPALRAMLDCELLRLVGEDRLARTSRREKRERAKLRRLVD